MSLFVGRRELLDRFRRGERRALEETYRHYAPLVGAFLSRGFFFTSGERTFRFVGYRSAFDLDNALAETFVRAFREPARLAYDGVQPYKSYLFTIARNFTIDEQRSRWTRSVVVDGEVAGRRLDEGEAGEAPAPSAEDALLAKELSAVCDRFVAGLNERDRAFFVARFTEERTQVDAGKTVGLSHMQARSLEKRLRGRLLATLRSGGYFEDRPAPEVR